jgi:anti-sigma B factor antagonist
MKTLVITPRINGDVTIVDLDGRIRLGEGSTELHEQIHILAAQGAKKVLLNMEKVSHIDSSGLGELVSAYTTLQNAAGELKLFSLSDRVHELMTMTKLLTVFDIFDNEEVAVHSFAKTESAGGVS